MKKQNELSIREQAAIRLYLHEDEDLSPVFVYKVAHRGDLEHVEGLKDIAANASRWIRSQKVVEYMNQQRSVLKDKKEKERLRIESEVVARMKQAGADSSAVPGMVDYSNPAAQLRKLNELINTADDPGEALDALKVLIAKQGELKPEATKEKVSRFYLPLSCKDCPLYQMAGDVLKLRSAQKYNNLCQSTKEEIDAKLHAGGRAIIEKYFKKLIQNKPSK
jgi:hypothetical protein